MDKWKSSIPFHHGHITSFEDDFSVSRWLFCLMFLIYITVLRGFVLSKHNFSNAQWSSSPLPFSLLRWCKRPFFGFSPCLAWREVSHYCTALVSLEQIRLSFKTQCSLLNITIEKRGRKDVMWLVQAVAARGSKLYTPKFQWFEASI